MAGCDRDGRCDEAQGGRDVAHAGIGRPSLGADIMTPRSTEGAQEQLREGQTFAHRGSRWLVYANFVKLPHTLFALPFALVGVVLASYRSAVTWPMVAAVVLASIVFVYAAWQLNPLCALLSPLALAWVMFYSFTKRFTRWCHLVLGLGMSIAPVGGYLAVTGRWSQPWWMLVALALAVATW